MIKRGNTVVSKIIEGTFVERFISSEVAVACADVRTTGADVSGARDVSGPFDSGCILVPTASGFVVGASVVTAGVCSAVNVVRSLLSIPTGGWVDSV